VMFEGGMRKVFQTGVSFSFHDYLILVDTIDRIQREDKRGFIPACLSPILERITIDVKEWLVDAQSFESVYLREYSRR
jgi:hypothetical protein